MLRESRGLMRVQIVDRDTFQRPDFQARRDLASRLHTGAKDTQTLSILARQIFRGDGCRCRCRERRGAAPFQNRFRLTGLKVAQQNLRSDRGNSSRGV